MTELPEPLVPADVDLRAFPFTPMFRARLFGSSFHAKATDAEWRAGVTLWLKSWDQMPAGTLPDDDVDLCRLAELGRDRKAWAKVKARALHGWVKCDDGRLHHAVVAEGVLEAWARHSAAKKKGKAGAEKRWGSATAPAIETDSAGNGSTTALDGSAIAQVMPGDSNGQGHREGQGEGEGHRTEPKKEELKIVSSCGSVAVNKRGFERGTVTIEDPAERLEIFKKSLVLPLGGAPGAWAIIDAACDPNNPQFEECLATCKLAADKIEKGWAPQWPTRAGSKILFDVNGYPELPAGLDAAKRRHA